MQVPKKNRMSLRLKQLFLSLISLALLFNLGACGKLNFFGNNDEEEAELSVPIRELLTKGMDRFNTGKYHLAIRYFDKILDLDPFSPEATLAELKTADCKYFQGHFVEAKLLYENFEERHPTNEAVPYVLYQMAMCSYNTIGRIDRDTSAAKDAIRSFNILLRTAPNSPFRNEAISRIRAAREFLANHEFFVVQFYLKQKEYSQAEIRLKYIINMYPESAYIPKAKELLTAIKAGNPPSHSFFSWLPGI